MYIMSSLQSKESQMNLHRDVRFLCFVFLEPWVFPCVGNIVFAFCKICHVYLYSGYVYYKRTLCL